MTAPRCQNCGDVLKALRRTAFAPHLVPSGATNIVEEPHRSGKNGRKYTFQPPGAWGPYGDGLFCSKRCGYEMAVKMVTLTRRARP
jgi:hypothetical protein